MSDSSTRYCPGAFRRRTVGLTVAVATAATVGATLVDTTAAHASAPTRVGVAGPAGRPAVTAHRPVAAPITATRPQVGAQLAARARGPVSRAPVGDLELAQSGVGGIHLAGWVVDPDSPQALTVNITLDGRPVRSSIADLADPAARRSFPTVAGNHGFAAVVPSSAGIHSVCLTAPDIAPARAATTRPGVIGCRYVRVVVNPIGRAVVAIRAATSRTITVSGWAADPQTDAPLRVVIGIDGRRPGYYVSANQPVPGLRSGVPGLSDRHGFSLTVPASAAAHRVCVGAFNLLAGTDTHFGCRQSNAVPTSRPSVVRSVRSVGGTLSAAVSWQAPVRTGGVPVTYRITSVPASAPVVAAANRRSATVSGLRAGVRYRFEVHAINGLGFSPHIRTTPGVLVRAAGGHVNPVPLISTSRYIRNLYAGDPAGNRLKSFAIGALDALHNPSNHRYLILVQFGGQSLSGNTQSATPNSWLTYAQTAAAMSAYLDGYHSAQRRNAPVTIAFGTNNDRRVSYTTGRLWAQHVVDPLVAHARRLPGITVAGADDIEPGFLGSMHQTQEWLKGYLNYTKAQFVFNGSADGCGWTSAKARCNNGYTAAGIQWMAGGAAPSRILALPQIYNYTQPKQWKYISLTGAVTGFKKLNFAGPLTEYSACHQAHNCGSLTNNRAWRALWNQLRSDARIRPLRLPYGTDLRIA